MINSHDFETGGGCAPSRLAFGTSRFFSNRTSRHVELNVRHGSHLLECMGTDFFLEIRPYTTQSASKAYRRFKAC